MSGPMRPAAFVFLALAALGCSSSAPPPTDAGAPDAEAEVCTGTVLFGRPIPATGLSDAQCQPICTCGGTSWEAPDYSAADADALLDWTLLEPYAEITTDPYAGPAPEPGDAGDDEVCAVMPEAAGSHSYRLATYPSEDAARAAGGIPSHFGACGVCSPLADLAVYMRYPDLTAPVRDCGLQNVGAPESAYLECLGALGFDLPCAQIWYYNLQHTAESCALLCLDGSKEPYNEPDGALNPCLQCDEDKSGAVFKAVAGRTRRNTGIASAMCRPCSEVRRLVHMYP